MVNITKRIDLNLGYTCNANCPFCYYKDSVRSRKQDKDLTTERAKELIRYLKKKGKEAIDFTGGEPTIRKDIFELISYAKETGFKEITIITNGIKLVDKAFVRELINAGVNDFLFSVHGHNSEIHDKLVGINGAFEKITRAIKNVKDMGGVRIRSNMVINGINFRNVLEITELLYNLGVQHVNFILFNPIVEASCSDEHVNVKYSEAAPYLRGAIDRYKDKFKRIVIRYLPFCFLPGYEKFISECPQIQYDPFEWDYFIRMKIRNGFFLSTLAWIIGLFLLLNVKRVMMLSFRALLREAMMRGLSFRNKTKGKICKKCKFDYICDGVWIKYAEYFGLDELKPLPGNRLKDPSIFLK